MAESNLDPTMLDRQMLGKEEPQRTGEERCSSLPQVRNQNPSPRREGFRSRVYGESILFETPTTPFGTSQPGNDQPMEGGR
jgi:hypothetical protein